MHVAKNDHWRHGPRWRIQASVAEECRGNKRATRLLWGKRKTSLAVSRTEWELSLPATVLHLFWAAWHRERAYMYTESFENRVQLSIWKRHQTLEKPHGKRVIPLFDSYIYTVAVCPVTQYKCASTLALVYIEKNIQFHFLCSRIRKFAHNTRVCVYFLDRVTRDTKTYTAVQQRVFFSSDNHFSRARWAKNIFIVEICAASFIVIQRNRAPALQFLSFEKTLSKSHVVMQIQLCFKMKKTLAIILETKNKGIIITVPLVRC